MSRAADILTAAVKAKSAITLGLATGGTMVPLYAELVARNRAGSLSLARATTFNLDEYVGLAPDHPGSCHRFMAEVLFDPTDMRASHAHLPHGDALDPKVEAQAFQARIDAAGGIDLQLLGLGQNGHIGFNEPTSSLGSRTRIKTLTVSTRCANRQYFEIEADVPRYAITMGIATILEARAIVLLATGSAKAAAASAMIEGPLSAVCPASALQLHPRATVVLDAGAASALQLSDHFQHVHPEGQDSVFS